MNPVKAISSPTRSYRALTLDSFGDGSKGTMNKLRSTKKEDNHYVANKLLMTCVSDTMIALRIHVMHSLGLYATTLLISLTATENVQFISFLRFVSIVISLLNACPIFLKAARVLLQAAPHSTAYSIRARRDQVLAIDGVVQCSEVHIWEESAADCAGSEGEVC